MKMTLPPADSSSARLLLSRSRAAAAAATPRSSLDSSSRRASGDAVSHPYRSTSRPLPPLPVLLLLLLLPPVVGGSMAAWPWPFPSLEGGEEDQAWVVSQMRGCEALPLKAARGLGLAD